MSRIKIEKTIVTLVLTTCWLLMPVIGYNATAPVENHLLYLLCHANFWHLAGNLFVLWLIPGRKLWIVPSVAIAVLCSWAPVLLGLWELCGRPADPTTMTVGFSGVLMAIVGILWGRWGREEQRNGRKHWQIWSKACVKLLPVIAIGAILPGLNWSIHLYCVVAGCAYGYITKR